MAVTFDQGKDEIARLADYYRTNRTTFHAPGFKEAHARQTLIDPFFIALGWDVRNEKQAAPQYREVIPEESLDVEGHRKAPDYAFRVGQTPKFYAEAKRPGARIKDDPGPAYQLRRYSWSAKLPLSILTDFEELAVHQCQTRPSDRDKADKGRIWCHTFEEYADCWRKIWDVFSREAVWSGQFDRFTESQRRKRGTSTVDAEFLKEIEQWRDALACNVALRNAKLSPDDLNKAVQLTIDRIIFLRMAEDRGVEPYERLLGLAEGSDIYRRFIQEACRRADAKYNSGLFHFEEEAGVRSEPDRLTPGLAVDDKVLKPILAGLYFPQSPYEFRAMPVEILGNVYEQFLGKVIRLTKGHQAKVEEKPEVRKAGGVYYTPAYVVEYIVKNTVGAMIEGKSPAQLAGAKKGRPLRVLDMACGSGSFLLGAYQCLLDHCLKWHTENQPEKHKTAVWQPNGQVAWRLTTGERKRILITHVFGVDIDPQAVEVSKLSLLLKVLEGENDRSLSRQIQMRLFDERALPNLDQNIQCGNSLIGSDYLNGRLIPDDEELKRVNPFDWKAGFPEAMGAGGFDCVIGNPPYVLLQNMDHPGALAYLSGHFTAAKYKVDTYQVFFERGLSLLMPGGRLGFITPNTFLKNKYAEALRAAILRDTEVKTIVLYDYNVFPASVDTCTIILRKRDRKSKVTRLHLLRSGAPDAFHLERLLDQADFQRNPDLGFNVAMSDRETAVVKRVASRGFRLGDIATAYFGIQTHDRDVYVKKAQRAKSDKPAIDGENIGRYSLSPAKEYVAFLPRNIKSGGRQAVYEQPRIVVRQIGAYPVASLAQAGIYALNTIYNVYFTRTPQLALEYVLGVMESSTVRFYWTRVFSDYKKTFPKIKKQALLGIPVPPIDFADAKDKARHDHMVTLVQQMLSFQKSLAAGKSEQARTVLERQIAATDAKIDRLVYDLYGLTEEEVAIVEGQN